MLPTLALAVLLPAAPVPKELTERGLIELKFGKPADPKGDSAFKYDEGKLRVILPATVTRELTAQADTAPRLIREVDGDFELVIGVAAELAKDAKSVKGSAAAFLGGGVRLAGRDGKEWVRYGCAHVRKADEQFAWVPWEVVPGTPLTSGDGRGDHVTGLRVGEKLELRIVRTGRTITTACRGRVTTGGWATGRTDWECVPDGPLTVSLFAHHSSDKAGAVTFSDYKITPLKEAKK